MRDKTQIIPYESRINKIYGYTSHDIKDREKYVKIGDTTREDVMKRIYEQVSQIGITPELVFERIARKKTGEWFRDHDLHKFLIKNKIKNQEFGTAKEWFYFGEHLEEAEKLTDKFINGDYTETQILEKDLRLNYILRDEQNEAVSKTIEKYFDENSSKEFLWNAKPRFGKTLTTYDFIRKTNAKKILIVTNRPAIANSWYEDFEKFISWQKPYYKFVSESDSLKNKDVMTRNEYNDFILSNKDFGMIYFISLQDLKGSKYFGGNYEKYKEVSELSWDILVIDEAHEGVDTLKTDKAFEKIKRSFTLHLSGTPFKALSSGKFAEENIFNWTYLDEQKAKMEWDNCQEEDNPYEGLPTLSLFTYQMSKIIEPKIEKGISIDEQNYDYAFDLNEFFKTDELGNFEYEDSVKIFLDNLTKGKFPFANTEYRHKLCHTLWILNRVSSVKALEKLLKEHEVFKDYKIIIAAGDGKSNNDYEDESSDYKKNQKSLDKVRDAIKNNDKTITLSVGQLTTGVTVAEWSGVMMLSNMKSPALYFQSAFRAQNPYRFTDKETGELFVKENAYVFDFAPERTLILFDEYANNLSSSKDTENSKSKENNIRKLLNFFPVIAEDSNGYMKEIDAEEVMTIPNKLKSQEVVKRGFMSNLLFENIQGIFQISSELKDILDKLEVIKNTKNTGKSKIDLSNSPMLNSEKTKVEIPINVIEDKIKKLFNEKIYQDNVSDVIDSVSVKEDDILIISNRIAKNIVKNISEDLQNVKTDFELKKKDIEKIQKNTESQIKNIVEKVKSEEKIEISIKDSEIEYVMKNNVYTQEEKEEKISELEKQKAEIKKETLEQIKTEIIEIPKKIVEEQITKVEENKKKNIEDDVRDHLRGFARAIPAFLMAYGDRNTTLENFDKVVDEKSFKELTSITIEEFIKLRDGGVFIDDEGNEKEFKGIFNFVVFNTSIQEFFNTKEKLSQYYDKEQDEDIFDYIPAQKTNQIFTPKKVAKRMVQFLEQENPELFKSKYTKFLDPYSKSGIYLVEIVKKLNKYLGDEIKDEKERIKWILENQVYTLAPTNIIYNIVKNYVLSNFENIDNRNIVEHDSLPDAVNHKLEESIKKIWGDEMKFDVIIGNPPYQENIEHRSEQPSLYNHFYDEAFELADIVSFITPARFLFNAGSTPTSWNEKMLNDEYTKVAYYEQKSDKVFPGIDIKGGVTILVRNKNKNVKPIEFFTNFEELRNITYKVIDMKIESISNILYSNTSYKYTEKLWSENPELVNRVSGGSKRYLSSSVFDKLEEIFYEENPSDGEEYIKILGRQNNRRVYKWVKRKYLINHENLDKYKVILPSSNGSGAIGEVLSTPLIGEPLIGHTETFISFGAFNNIQEAKNLFKYIKTKFLRALLGVKKITQGNKNKEVWKYVPLQDFTSNSDIDWSLSIPEIDQQLYKKYNISKEEIKFIEEKVKPME
ncbi:MULTISPECIES: Eco57I restriction-modification methylase domain-containing protein [Helcococcus]|uniref:Eco57I restriction-modification methylase domain-containing protein n=1 Tax=Helcococcus bovis TaxID=3153252 RepID=A0ABW9F563_9FIRM